MGRSISCRTNSRALLFGGAALVIAMALAVDRVHAQSVSTPGDRQIGRSVQGHDSPAVGETLFPLPRGCRPGGEPEPSALSDKRGRAAHPRALAAGIWRAVHTQEMPTEPPLPTPQERGRWAARSPSSSGREADRRRATSSCGGSTRSSTTTPCSTCSGSGRARWRHFDPQKGMPEAVRVVLHRWPRPIVVPLPPDDVATASPTSARSSPAAVSAGEIPGGVAAGDRDAGRRRAEPREAPAAMQARDVRRGPSSGGWPRRDGVQMRQAARTFVAAFGRRAFRRPMTDDEIARYFCAVHGGRPSGVSRSRWR